MKLVGGPEDGKEVMLEPGQESYRVLQIIESTRLGIRDYARHFFNEPVTVKATEYTVRQLVYAHPPSPKHPLDPVTGQPELEMFLFMAPAGMTDLEAVKHQFSK